MIPDGHEGVDSKARTTLGWLLGARLFLAGLALALAVTLDRIEGTSAGPSIWGVYWTVAAAFFATVVSGLLVGRTRHPTRFATVQVAIDVAIVTALVHFSGAGESVFTFLYALVILYGALFLDRNGVFVSSGLAAVGYGFVLFGTELGWLPSVGVHASTRPLPVLGAVWIFHVGALLALGMLANRLSAELRRTGAALDRRTTDLRRLRDLHLRTVESIGSGLLTIDVAGRITSFNPEAERITGKRLTEVRGEQLDDVIPGAAALVTEGEHASRSEPTGGRVRLPFRNVRDEALFLGLAASRLRDEDGTQVGHVVIFQDVTAVVSMERELRESERLAAVGEMAARMAHEIRNPLASISGSVQMLQRPVGEDEGSADPEQARLMGIVLREVERLNRLIGDFLRYSRPAPIEPELVDLSDLVAEIAEMSGREADSTVELELELDPDRVRVSADPSLLKAVVWNLWNNAREAMEDHGRLRVRVSRLPADAPQAGPAADRNARGGLARLPSAGKGIAVFEIEDSGPGIDADVRALIFEPFFTTKRDGTGLGLATVRRIVEQHEGVIEVTSDPGKGACFRVLLPCAESTP